MRKRYIVFPVDVCLSYSRPCASAPSLKGAIQLCILDKNEYRWTTGGPPAESTPAVVPPTGGTDHRLAVPGGPGGPSTNLYMVSVDRESTRSVEQAER